jgi:hypothetical protein
MKGFLQILAGAAALGATFAAPFAHGETSAVSRLETVEARRVELANPVRPILFSTQVGTGAYLTEL